MGAPIAIPPPGRLMAGVAAAWDRSGRNRRAGRGEATPGAFLRRGSARAGSGLR
jgi:hypothetical protein